MTEFETLVISRLQDQADSLAELHAEFERRLTTQEARTLLILEQTTKTNGSVGELRHRVERIETHCAQRTGEIGVDVEPRLQELEKEKRERDGERETKNRAAQEGRNRWRIVATWLTIGFGLIGLILEYIFDPFNMRGGK